MILNGRLDLLQALLVASHTGAGITDDQMSEA